MKNLTITKTQEKYLKELLIKQLSGQRITIGGYSGTKKITVGSYDYNGKATNSIVKMLGIGGLGFTKKTNSIYFRDVVFNIKDVLTKLKNGRQIIDDVMTGLVLYSEFTEAHDLKNATYEKLEKDAVTKGINTFWNDIHNNETKIGSYYYEFIENAVNKHAQYKQFVQQF